mgnify:FL=1
MDLEYILEELKPLDYLKESKCLTLIFDKEIIIFLREWEEEELMWHVFENKQSIDAGAEKKKKIIPMLKRYLNDNRRAV